MELLEELKKKLEEVREDMFMEEMKDYIDWSYYKALEEKEANLKKKIAEAEKLQ